MSSSGVISLGSRTSLTSSDIFGPAVIQNPDGDTWLTIENRSSAPLGVAFGYNGNPDISIPLTVPPLTRSTLPVDPGINIPKDIIVYIGNTQIGFTAGQLGGTTYNPIQANIPYILHSAGGAPSEQLFPLDRCWPVASEFTITQALGVQYIDFINADIGYQAPATENQIMGLGNPGFNPDSMIMGVTLMLKAKSLTSPARLRVQTSPSNVVAGTMGGWMPFVDGDSVGATAFIAMMAKAVFYDIVGGANGDTITIRATYLVGMPGSLQDA